MRGVKSALSNWGTYKRARGLWEEYLEVSLSDLEAADEKLSHFLTAFKEAHSELEGGEAMDRMFGDCTDILLSLLAMFDVDAAAAQEASVKGLLNKAIEVTELIIRDEKYRQVVKATPALLSQMINLLSVAEGTDAKKLVLRMISSFGSGSENKMLVGRQGAFQTMLELLAEGDEDLSREVLKTLKHFLDVQDVGGAGPRHGARSHGGTAEPDEADSMVGVIGGFANYARKRVYQTGLGFTQIVFGEVPGGGNSMEDKIQRVLAADSAADTAAAGGTSFVPGGAATTVFPPSRGALHLAYTGYAQAQLNARSSLHARTGAPEAGEGDGDGDGETPPTSGTEDQVMKDFMRVQGVLSTLTISIPVAARSVQLEMMQTISQLLLRNSSNQDQFRDCNGYTTLLQMFGSITDCQSTENRVFLEDLFDTIFTIAMDGSPERAAANPDAMKLLVDIACTAQQTEVQLHAVRCIQDLLTANYTNAAVLHSINGDTTITHTLLCSVPDSAMIMDSTMTEALVALLEYMMFLLSPHNLVPLWNLVNLVAQAQSSPDRTENMDIVLLGVLSNVLCDLRARCVPASLSKLLPSIATILKTVSMRSDALCSGPSVPKLLLLMEIFGTIIRSSDTLESDLAHTSVVPLLVDIILDQRHVHFQEPRGQEDSLDPEPEAEPPSHDAQQPAEFRQDLAARHFSLWLLHDIVISASVRGCSSNLIKWMVVLLRAPLDSDGMKQLVFRVVRDVGLSSAAAKKDFRLAGGLDALSHVLLEHDASFWHMALQAMNAMMRDCEENKVYFVERILQGNFPLVLRNAYRSGRPIGVVQFHMLLEICCTGPVYQFLANLADTRGMSRSDSRDVPEQDANAGGDEPRPARARAPAAPCWTGMISHHIKRITGPPFLFPAGPPFLSRPYAFLIALQRQRENDAADDHDGPHSPRINADYHDVDGQSHMSDSASESSSMRDSIEVASRDLALQALLKAGRAEHRPPRWWELGRRRERTDASKAADFEPMGITEADEADQNDQDDMMMDHASSFLDFQGIKALDGSVVWRPGAGGWATRYQSAHLAGNGGNAGVKLPPKVTVRGHGALSLLLDSILLADKAMQPAMIASLLHLAASGLAARRALYSAGGLQLFLELSMHVRFSESEKAQRLAHVMVAVIGRYSISASEVSQLFSMAYTVRSLQKQLRLLQVIAAIAQRWEPTALIHFNGPVPGLYLQQLDKFPKPQTGYTFCAWIKLRTLLEPGENLLFCWKDTKYIIMELFVRVWPQHDGPYGASAGGSASRPHAGSRAPRRNLCVRMRNSPCTHTEYFTFDGFSFQSVDQWYHLVVTHNKHLLTLYVDGRFVQSFQPLNYPVGVSKTYPLRGVVGCPKVLDSQLDTAFADRMTGSFCGEVGLLHVTEGVWDAASAEATAQGFPYQRKLQSAGVNHRQLLCVDPLSYAALPESSAGDDASEMTDMSDMKSLDSVALGSFEHTRSDPLPHERAAVSVQLSSSRLESHREVQREATRSTEASDLSSSSNRAADESMPLSYGPFTGPEYFSDFVVIQEAVGARGQADITEHILNAARRTPSPPPDSTASISGTPLIMTPLAVSGTQDEKGDIESSMQAGTPIAGPLSPSVAPPSLSTELSSGAPSLEIFTVEGLRIAGQAIRLQGDVDIHHAGSLHDVSQEAGDFYLPLPFLVLSRPQRVLGWRILLEMLYGSENAVKTFRDARAATVLLHVIRTRSNFDKNLDVEFDAIFEMLREGTLPVEDCMRLIVDLLLVEHTPLSNNMRHLQMLSDMFTGAHGIDELDRERLLQAGVVMVRKWKERGGGMVAAMDMLSRSSGDVTELLLDVIKLMWQPTFTTEDLEMMLEFCLGSVEGKILALFDESDSDDDEDSEDTENEGLDQSDSYASGSAAGIDDAANPRPYSGGSHKLPPLPVKKIAGAEGDGVSLPRQESIDSEPAAEVDGDRAQAGAAQPARLSSAPGSVHIEHHDSGDHVNGFVAEIDEHVVRALGIAGCEFNDAVPGIDEWSSSSSSSLDGNLRPGRSEAEPHSEAEDDAARIVETKVKVLIFLRELLVAKAPDTAVELLRGAGGFQVLFGLLSSPDERSRLLALDLFGLMLCHGKPADAKAFTMMGGFETVGRYLVRHWVSLPVGRALLSLSVRRPGTAVDTNEWLEGRSHFEDSHSAPNSPSASGRSASSESDEEEVDTAPRIGNFDALYCLLQLLQFGTTDMPVAREIAENIQGILTAPANLERLLSHNFTDWVLAFLAKVQRHASSNRAGMHHRSPIYRLVTRILGSLVLEFVPHVMVPKVLKQLRRVIVDAAEFGIHVFDDVLAHYESNPILMPHEAGNSIKNLASMFEQIDEQTDLPVETYVRIVRLINDLACRNDSTARNIMKLCKLLDTRDILMLHCLKCDSSMEARYELAALPFESVVDHPTFRDKHGLVYLLRHMHLAQSDPALQVLFAGVIKNVFGTVEENRKLIARTMDDVEVNTRLLGNSSSDNVNQWLRILPGKEQMAGGGSGLQVAGGSQTPPASASDWMGGLDRSPMRGAPGPAASSRQGMSVSPVRQRPVSPSSSAVSSIDEDDGLANEFTDCEEFLDWYYSPDQDTRRDLIDSRITTALGPSDKVWRKLTDKQTTARQKSLKSRIEIARGKEVAAVDNFNEEDKKVRARVKKMGANHIRRVQQSIADRRSRRRDGRNAWRDLVNGEDLRDPASTAFSLLPWQAILHTKRSSLHNP